MNYTRISDKCRVKIETLLNDGKSIRQIAKILCYSPSTISREIKRVGNALYTSELASADSATKRTSRYKNPSIKYKEQIEFICANHNKLTKSVRVVDFAFKSKFKGVKTVGWQHLYKLIKQNKINITKKDLTYKKHKKDIKNGMIEHLKYNLKHKTVLPIALRPKYIEKRNEIGHLEIDSVIGKKNEYERVISIVDRTSRMLYLIKCEYPQEYYVANLIYKFIVENKIETKSITVDNGFEFNALGIAAKKLGVKLYKCDTYCSFQRGSNERMNAIFRRFYPKGSSFKHVSQQSLYNVERMINSMPREIFDFKAAYEVYNIFRLKEVLR